MLIVIPDSLKHHPEYLSFSDIFESRTGLGLSRFMALIWVVMAKYQSIQAQTDWLAVSDYAFTFKYLATTSNIPS